VAYEKKEEDQSDIFADFLPWPFEGRVKKLSKFFLISGVSLLFIWIICMKVVLLYM